MNNELQVLEEQEVLGKNFRVYGTVENPLFLAKDVANWIEHNKPSEMIRNVDEDEKIKVFCNHGDNIARVLQVNTEYWFLTEAGLYEVLMQSRKPIAKQFKKKVKEILKALRLNKVQIQPTNTNNNNLYDVQQINELITTVNNLASTVNVLLSHMMEDTENKLNFKNEKVAYKEELDLIPQDEIETEIINTFKTITTVQEYCKFLNSKKIIIKKLGVMVFNQVARDNGIYDDYNYPTDDYKKYFIVNYGKLFLTTKSMILMYRKIKEQVVEGYIVRR